MTLATIYAYGFSSGIFFTMFLCFMMLFLLHQFRRGSNQNVASIFFYGGISILCFGMLDVYAMSHEVDTIKSIVPDWILTIGRYAAPLGLFLNFHLFMQSLPINSVNAFVTWNKYKQIYPVFFIYFLTSFCILFTIKDPLWSIIVPMVLIVLNHIILFPLQYQTLHTVPDSKNYLKAVFLVIIAVTLIIALFLSGYFDQLSTLTKAILHILLASIFLAYNFVLCQFLLKGSFSNEEVSGINATELYKDIYTAINNNEFYLEYQPKVDLNSQKVQGLEALIRWEHPKEGFISPAQFIVTAEKTQLINEICRWVIKQTIKDIVLLRANNIYAPISINFSVNNLNPPMVMFLQQALRNENLPMDAITVEITESVFLDISSDVQKSIVLLNQIGIKVSLDDFGAGYSSLRHLSDMGFREVKIDRGLISKIFDPKQQVVIKTIINMCQSLNISIVAEGINEKIIIPKLLDMSCTIGQGYFICRPKRIEPMIDWISNNEVQNLVFR